MVVQGLLDGLLAAAALALAAGLGFLLARFTH